MQKLSKKTCNTIRVLNYFTNDLLESINYMYGKEEYSYHNPKYYSYVNAYNILCEDLLKLDDLKEIKITTITGNKLSFGTFLIGELAAYAQHPEENQINSAVDFYNFILRLVNEKIMELKGDWAVDFSMFKKQE